MIDSKEIPIAIGSSHNPPAAANIFLDLGFPPAEAARLKVASQRAIEIRRSLLEALASLPNVGKDADFTRI